jgi:hypothetical protein
MDKEKVAVFLEEMIELLTLRRVALLTILTTVLIILLVIFENRSAVFATAYRGAESSAIKWELSDQSKSDMMKLTELPAVGAVMISDVDLKRNHRSPKYYYVEDQEVRKLVDPTMKNLLPQALFDFDPKNTEQMVSMLNNEFRCDNIADTNVPKLFPEPLEPMLIKKYPKLCRIAVPPFFGEYAGYLTVFLVQNPDQRVFDELKIELNRVAVEIYLRDLAKKVQQ